MRLAEHEHQELQLEAHFSPASLTRKDSSVMPDTFHLIPSTKPHIGSWDEGSEFIVFLLDTRQLEIASDELLRRPNFLIQDEIWGSDSLIQSVAGVLRREFLAGTNDPMFLEALRTTLSGHLVRSFRQSEQRAMGNCRLPFFAVLSR